MLYEKFWLAVAFLSFVTLMIKYVWPLLAKALDSKSKSIAEEILAAKEMKDGAEKLLAKAEKLHHEAVLFAQKLVKDTENEVQKLIAESQQILDEELAKRKTAALDRIKFEEESAIRELKIKIVNSALGKLTKELDLGQEGHEKLIEKTLNNLDKTVH